MANKYYLCLGLLALCFPPYLCFNDERNVRGVNQKQFGDKKSEGQERAAGVESSSDDYDDDAGIAATVSSLSLLSGGEMTRSTKIPDHDQRRDSSLNIPADSSSSWPNLGPKIVGGNEASAGDYPWYSALYRNRSGNETNLDFYCGGNLISPSFVLTAAHCNTNIGDLVLVGALCPYENGNCNQQYALRFAKALFQDPRYTKEITLNLGWDYMLIQLSEPIDTITPVSLDNGLFSSKYSPGKLLWVAGMGFTDVINKVVSLRLNQLQLEYIPEDSCKEKLKPALLGQFTICAADSSRMSDVCNGDSGGPLFDRENNVLVGLTSYGDSSCQSMTPGVYAKISDNFAWFQSTVCHQDPSADLCSDAVVPTTSPAPTSKWCDDAEVKLTLATDSFPYENSWALTELMSNTLVAIGSLSGFQKNEEHDGNFCLPIQNDECYRFDIDDSEGNGIDLNGSSVDYCLTINDETIECNVNFEGNREAIIFPKDNCKAKCNITSYVLKIRTGIDLFREESQTSISITDESTGQLVYPYSFSGFKPNTSYSFPIDLCRGSYQLKVDERGNTDITIYDSNGNIVVKNDDLEKNGIFTSIDATSFSQAVPPMKFTIMVLNVIVSLVHMTML